MNKNKEDAMPVQPKDTSLDKLKKAGPDVLNSGSRKKDQKDEEYPQDDADLGIENEPNQVNYGFGQDAELNTEGEQTEAQEYQADGLPRTNKYSVDNTVHGTKEHSKREGRTGGV